MELLDFSMDLSISMSSSMSMMPHKKSSKGPKGDDYHGKGSIELVEDGSSKVWLLKRSRVDDDRSSMKLVKS
jgi:hypothetical protein